MLMTRRSILTAGALMATPGLARAQTGAFKGKTLTVASWQNYGADDPATLQDVHRYDRRDGEERVLHLRGRPVADAAPGRRGPDRRVPPEPPVRAARRAAIAFRSGRHRQGHDLEGSRTPFRRRSFDPAGRQGLCDALGAGRDVARRQSDRFSHRLQRAGRCSGSPRARARSASSTIRPPRS